MIKGMKLPFEEAVLGCGSWLPRWLWHPVPPLRHSFRREQRLHPYQGHSFPQRFRLHHLRMAVSEVQAQGCGRCWRTTRSGFKRLLKPLMMLRQLQCTLRQMLVQLQCLLGQMLVQPQSLLRQMLVQLQCLLRQMLVQPQCLLRQMLVHQLACLPSSSVELCRQTWLGQTFFCQSTFLTWLGTQQQGILPDSLVDQP